CSTSARGLAVGMMVPPVHGAVHPDGGRAVRLVARGDDVAVRRRGGGRGRAGGLCLRMEGRRTGRTFLRIGGPGRASAMWTDRTTGGPAEGGKPRPCGPVHIADAAGHVKA